MRGSVAVLVVVTLLLTGLATAPAALAADSFVFIGRGNGHAAGMSQWGAWQGAREGNSFAQILAFYYPGTALEPTNTPDAVLKVRISSKPWTSNTTSFSRVDLGAAVSPATLYASPGGDTWIVPEGMTVGAVNSGGKVYVTVAGETFGPYDYIELRPEGSGASEGRVEIGLTTSGGTAIDPRQYWGTIRVQFGDDPGELWVYNFVALEKYVRSIAEVDYDWATVGGDYYAPEAVKAQAVASRTYAVAKNGTLADNWADQCYRGYSFEAKYPGIARAAEETAGLILTYEGRPITAFFSGHSGGYTSDSAWSGSMPTYIVAQPDPWSLRAPPSGVHNGPGWVWNYTISADGLSAEVNGSLKDTSGRTLNIGRISAVEVASRDTGDEGSHARTLRLTGATGTATVSVSSFRSLIGTSNLLSTLIVSINGATGLSDPVTGDPGSGGIGGADPGAGLGGTDPDDGGGGTGDVPAQTGEFRDVGSAHLYHDEIARVIAAGLMSGYSGDLFKPEGTVTRSQFAKIAVSLYNAMHATDPIEVVNVTVRPFDDVAVDSKTTGDSSDWIAAAKNAGLISGVTPTDFFPQLEIRRDQMATMMCRALGWDDEAAALSPGTPGFSDVPFGSVHWAAAAYVRQQGIIVGYADPDDASVALLRADLPIKRQHVAVILCRVLDLAQ